MIDKGKGGVSAANLWPGDNEETTRVRELRNHDSCESFDRST